MRSRFHLIFPVYIFLFFVLLNESKSQCFQSLPVPVSTAVACSGGDGQVAEGQNIGAGNVYWHNSGNLTLNSVSMNGGILRVCGGVLTLNSITWNSGTVVVENGGELIYNGSNLNMNGGCEMVNRGIITWNADINIQNNNNFIWNLGTGTFNVTGQVQMNSSTSKIMIAHDFSTGDFSVGNLSIQTASVGSICFSTGGCISVNGDITNNFANSAEVEGSGNAGIYFTGNAQLNSNWTADTNMLICLDPSTSISGGAGWGAADTINNCTSCTEALPLTLLYLNGRSLNENTNILSWATANEIDIAHFQIEKSFDGLNWVILGIIQAEGTEEEGRVYEFMDSNSITNAYYRLQSIGSTGLKETQRVVFVEKRGIKSRFDICLTPNPITTGSELIFQSEFIDIVRVEIFDIHGKNIELQKAIRDKNQFKLVFTPDTQDGLYISKIYTDDGNVNTRRIIVK